MSDGKALQIEWADRSTSTIPGSALRSLCECSRCLSEQHGRSEGRISLGAMVDASGEITRVDLPGSSRLSVDWGDRHPTSYFRFTLLLETFPPAPGAQK